MIYKNSKFKTDFLLLSRSTFSLFCNPIRERPLQWFLFLNVSPRRDEFLLFRFFFCLHFYCLHLHSQYLSAVASPFDGLSVEFMQRLACYSFFRRPVVVDCFCISSSSRRSLSRALLSMLLNFVL